MLIVTMFLILFSFYSFHALQERCRRFISRRKIQQIPEESSDHVPNENVSLPKMKLPLRIKRCAVKLSLLGYITISNFAFISTNCISIGSTPRLYIDANIECYMWWQWLAVAFIIVWVAPYSLTLYYGSSLLSSSHITPNEFLLILMFPPSILFFSLRSHVHGALLLSQEDEDIAALYLGDLYGPFRLNEFDSKLVKW